MFLLFPSGVEKADHSFVDGGMHVIWARGQDQGNYKHSPASGLEGNAKDKAFYRPDELKYHGSGNQRGYLSINFMGRSFFLFYVFFCKDGNC